MAYIWEDYSVDKIYKVSTKKISPYLEVWDTSDKVVFANIFYRLYEVLLPRAVIDTKENGKRLLELYETDKGYQAIADMIIHYIAQLDRKKGIDLQEIAEWLLRREIRNGKYDVCQGMRISEMFETLKKQEQQVILHYLAIYQFMQQRETVFDVALRALFPDIQLYYENSTGTVYVSVNEKDSECRIACFRICEYFFKDRDLRVQIFWNGGHPGIIGIEEMMRTGQLVLV